MLDERRWEDWLALFAEDGWYWVPLEEGQDNPREVVSLIYDDRRLLETRIRRLAEAALHAQTPASRTSRIVANVDRRGGGRATRCTVRAKFEMVESRRDIRRDLRRHHLAPGCCATGDGLPDPLETGGPRRLRRRSRRDQRAVLISAARTGARYRRA